VLARNDDGTLNLLDPPAFSEIAADPILANIRLIAEPWDAADGYLMGRCFPGTTWMQWNGRFRDLVKRFVRGDEGLVAELVTRVYGSDDLFPDDLTNARHPFQSINYIASHDGFTLYDTVAYNEKHNLANGEDNKDGPSDNLSWNCGYEGDDGVPSHVQKLRQKQVKNYFTLLMLSNGTPMFRMGDEFLQSQHGNSNPWNQDNSTTWLDWSKTETNASILRFVELLIDFRKAHKAICRSRFWRSDVCWYGPNGPVDFSNSSHTLAYCLKGKSQEDDDLYVMVNMYWEDLLFSIQEDGPWLGVINTSLESPHDFFEPADRSALHNQVVVAARSVIVLMKTSRQPAADDAPLRKAWAAALQLLPSQRTS
jgi:glycogen operon protein